MKLFFFVILPMSLVLSKLQTVNVVGRITCDGRYIENVKVALMEYDFVDSDDKLQESYSDKDGRFSLRGSEDEYGKIEPYILITHICGVTNKDKCMLYPLSQIGSPN